VEGEAEDQHHEARGCRERHRQRGIRAPERVVLFLDDDDLAGQRLDQPRNRHGTVAVRKRDVVDDALLRGRGQQLRHADHVKRAVVVADTVRGGEAAKHAVIGAGNDDVAAGGGSPVRNHVRQQGLQPLEIGGAVLP
jgi:hypothetical protein